MGIEPTQYKMMIACNTTPSKASFMRNVVLFQAHENATLHIIVTFVKNQLHGRFTEHGRIQHHTRNLSYRRKSLTSMYIAVLLA